MNLTNDQILKSNNLHLLPRHTLDKDNGLSYLKSLPDNSVDAMFFNSFNGDMMLVRNQAVIIITAQAKSKTK